MTTEEHCGVTAVGFGGLAGVTPTGTEVEIELTHLPGACAVATNDVPLVNDGTGTDQVPLAAAVP